MKHFFRGGRGLSFRKGGQVNILSCEQGLYERPEEENNRLYDRLSTMSPSGLLHFTSRSIGTQRNDETGRNGMPRILMIFCVLFSSFAFIKANAQRCRVLSRAFGFKTSKVVLFIWVVFFGWFFPHEAKGQYYAPTAKSIYIGDRVPEAFYQVEHEAIDMQTMQPTKIRLRDYRDRLIILDYWATWCGPCIYSLGKLDSIARSIESKDFIVVPITYQSVPELVNRKHLFDKLAFTTIIKDTVTSQYFPHQTLPYMVWIKDGKVLAFPKSDYATAENINKAIKGDPFEVFTVHQARLVDPAKPLFENGNGESIHMRRYGNVKIVGHTPTYAMYGTRYYKDSTRQVLYASNQALALLLDAIFKNDVFPKYTFSDIVWNVHTSHQGLYKPLVPSVVADQRQDSLYQSWLENNTFGFAMEAPLDTPLDSMLTALKAGMREYMKERFGIAITVEKRNKERYVELHTITSPDKVKQLLTIYTNRKKGIYNDTSAKIYIGRSFGDQFINVLNGMVSQSKGLNLTVRSVIDKAGLEQSMLTNFSVDHSLFDGASFADINKFLKRYGLKLVVREEYVSALVVSDGPKKDNSTN